MWIGGIEQSNSFKATGFVQFSKQRIVQSCNCGSQQSRNPSIDDPFECSSVRFDKCRETQIRKSTFVYRLTFWFSEPPVIGPTRLAARMTVNGRSRREEGPLALALTEPQRGPGPNLTAGPETWQAGFW